MENIKEKLAVVVSNANKNVTPFDTIDAIANSGFKNVFIQWYNRNWSPTQERQLEYIKDKNLNIIFAHLGYDHINEIWIEDSTIGKHLVQDYKKDLDICHKNGIHLVIMHAQGKHNPPMYNKIGLERFQEIINYAEKLEIRVALENTKVQGYLEYLLDNIPNENLGICFDSGHYHVHFKDYFPFEKFRNKIFAVHLHDNDQTDDQHILPFDGTLDWNQVMKNLKFCNYTGPITLEVVYRNQYLKMSPIEFYQKAFEIGTQLYQKLEIE